MKPNKNADTVLFLLLFTKSQCEKNIEKTFFGVQGLKKGEEQRVLGIYIYIRRGCTLKYEV